MELTMYKPTPRKWDEFKNDPIKLRVIKMMAECKDNMVYVPITDNENEKVNIFSNQKTPVKRKEYGHQKDHNQEHKRSSTGQSGELAVEKHFGIPVVDWTVGDSRKYNHADLKLTGYNLGVKCATIGNTPLVPRNPKHAEIICVKYDDNTVIICGIATKEVIEKYWSDDFVRDKNALHKTGFVGFDHLLPCRILEDLEPFKI